MIGVYFSGTGNTKYCVERFMQKYDPAGETYSIEAENVVQAICAHREIIMGYPVQFSSVPKILQDFIVENSCIWQNKRIFITATMGLFSGDGAGVLARLLRKYGAVITGGLHLKMPDSIGDEKALKRTLAQNQELVSKAGRKIEEAAQALKNGCPPQDGMGVLNHLAGLFGQRLYFYNKTKAYSDNLKIDGNKCIRCGKCVSVCPMKNISLKEGQAMPDGRCTMCYRCISLCPVQAITLLGKKVYEQCRIEKYL
ncbi:MAG: EFR1 family ferrodoxin [Oscillospiraceae bacterium]|nr:4Fe-4S binding protein [Oscillospiraceae bacterium]MDE6996772.1 EFR1 family ferrodoxin [Oscillospiraceae bacterium]